MELEISGRWAIVCAASKGLGLACARALAKEGVNLVINARGNENLLAAAVELRSLAPSIEVRTVAGDVSELAVREKMVMACPQVDILINNAGGPPPGDFRDWQRDDWLKALDANMLTPIELIKACVDGMAERGFGRIVNITSGAVKAPIDVLGLSNGARSGLTGFIAGLARQSRLAGNNVTINNLLPGPFETERLHKTLTAAAEANGASVEQISKQRRENVPAQRFGQPDEFGAYCAFICSAHAGFLTGQNLLLDGGSFPGTF
ncbi:SDR family oxidoreductase [Pseudomonas sp. ES4]|uniref:SDR family oxidoreductase n=1 Tax=Pseudomonas sp. ES4 TaxID=3424777 RepID=UPI003D357915